MTLEERFTDAQARIKRLPISPGPDTLLELYALYKQGTSGDATGSRPGMLDVKARAKHDAWSRRKSMTKDAAMTAYCALVDRLAPVGK